MLKTDRLPARLFAVARQAKSDGEQNIDSAPLPPLIDVPELAAQWDALDDATRSQWRRFAMRISR